MNDRQVALIAAAIYCGQMGWPRSDVANIADQFTRWLETGVLA